MQISIVADNVELKYKKGTFSSLNEKNLYKNLKTEIKLITIFVEFTKGYITKGLDF